jgi:hypothetical protein
MPTLAELRSRYAPSPETSADAIHSEEEFVVDARGQMSPTQMVETKLRLALLNGALSGADLVTAEGKRRAAK